jgi:hypothetical protein
MAPRNIGRWVVFVAPVLVFAVVLARLGHTGVGWSRWRPATCMPASCFCEAVGGGAVRQVANAWSSMGFVVVGAWVLSFGTGVRTTGGAVNPITRSRVYGVVYGIAVLLVGFGSAFYHASLTFAGQFADVLGMYLLATFIFLYNLSRLYRPRAATVVLGYVLLNSILAALLYGVPVLRRYLFAAVLVSALVPEYLIRRERAPDMRSRYLLAALAVMSAGFGIWILDITRVACGPDGWLQGHAVWHLCGAAASLLVFLYYASERTASTRRPGFD